VAANGVAQSTVTVTARDAFGNPRQGDTVTLAVTGSAIATDPGATTGANGQTSGVVTNTVAQPVTVSAQINSQLITPTAPIQFTAGGVSAATSIVDATTPVVANGVAMSTITVTARDANNNPVPGLAVSLAITPTPNGVLTQPGGVTNAAGQVTGTLTSTVPGPRTVTATIGVTPVTDTAVVNFTAGTLASFEWTQVDGSAVAGVPEQVRLTARDAQGNTVTNYTGTPTLTASSAGVGTVTWSTLGAGTLTPTASNTATYTFAASDNGTVLLTATDTRAETITLTATAGTPSGTSG
jgi:adhesin/invasin